MATLMAGASDAQQLAPDDTTISAGLQLWLRDAAANFDPDTGTWSDSSGHQNHATTVGEIDISGPVTYIAPTLNTTSGGSFSATEVPAVSFSGFDDDLLETPGLNGGLGMENITIFAVYNMTFIGGNPNLTRALGIGSVAATQENPGNHVNLSTDPSIRKDNGQLGAGQYSEAFPVETLFIRSARMSPDAIDDWFNTGGSPVNVFSVAGSSYTTSVDRFYLGDLRAGVTNVPGFGAATSSSDFDIVQVLVYNSTLTDTQVSGVNEWLTNNITGAGANPASPAPPVTAFSFDPDTGTASLTWDSDPGASYTVFYTSDLTDLQKDGDVGDSLVDGGAFDLDPAENSIRHEFANPTPASTRRFFSVHPQ
ncbi:MAG: hypothetical protein P8J87_14915 [Verrucomicrobiales bacterium]|nr:hypothetical protein [Verrucomicrobiales bacterium]